MRFCSDLKIWWSGKLSRNDFRSLLRFFTLLCLCCKWRRGFPISQPHSVQISNWCWVLNANPDFSNRSSSDNCERSPKNWIFPRKFSTISPPTSWSLLCSSRWLSLSSFSFAFSRSERSACDFLGEVWFAWLRSMWLLRELWVEKFLSQKQVNWC